MLRPDIGTLTFGAVLPIERISQTKINIFGEHPYFLLIIVKNEKGGNKYDPRAARSKGTLENQRKIKEMHT